MEFLRWTRHTEGREGRLDGVFLNEECILLGGRIRHVDELQHYKKCMGRSLGGIQKPFGSGVAWLSVNFIDLISDYDYFSLTCMTCDFARVGMNYQCHLM